MGTLPPPDLLALTSLIAESCFATFDQLPTKGKPRRRDNGSPEWTVLAGFVLRDRRTGERECVALATGVKCLPWTKLPRCGDVIHDCHAEILARRSLIRWLHAELSLAQAGQSAWLEKRPYPHPPPDGSSEAPFFGLREDAELNLYISKLPCGDASTVYLSDTQDPAEAALYDSPLSPAPTPPPPPGTTASDSPNPAADALRGRKGYTNFGALRTKPGRADAPTTFSLSCSDKLATYTVLGVQGTLLSSLLAPLYIDRLVIGGVGPSSPSTSSALSEEDLNRYRAECKRALFERIGVLDGLPPLFEQRPPEVLFTPLPFVHSLEHVLTLHPECAPTDPQPGMECMAYVAGLHPPVEVIVHGIKMGGSLTKRKSPLVPLRDRIRSRLCKLDLLRSYLAVRQTLNLPPLPSTATYHNLKRSAACAAYRQAKTALRGGEREDEGRHAAASLTTATAPFGRWLVTGKEFSSWDAEGRIPDVDVRGE